MLLEEAKQILEDNGYLLERFKPYYEHCPECGEKVDINNDLVCPNCGFDISEWVNNGCEDVNESTNLNESIDKRYLDYAIQDVADQLYEEELSDEQPEVDEYGNVNLEYFKRFEYTSPELRRACKRAATKLSNDLKESGIKINPWYCEMEIYDKLRYFAK